MAKKRQGLPHTLKNVFASPKPDYMETAKICFKADKMIRDFDRKYGDQSKGISIYFWWLPTFLFVLLNMLRVPIIILAYCIYGWLLLECLYFIFAWPI